MKIFLTRWCWSTENLRMRYRSGYLYMNIFKNPTNVPFWGVSRSGQFFSDSLWTKCKGLRRSLVDIAQGWSASPCKVCQCTVDDLVQVRQSRQGVVVGFELLAKHALQLLVKGLLHPRVKG